MRFYSEDVLARAESSANLSEAMAIMREMSLDGFGQALLNNPNASYPRLSAMLPHKTPDAVQTQWTGSSGETLLRQSVSFCNFLVANYTTFTGRQIADAAILDFGCGWGRILRLMYYFCDPARMFGCDAWDVSLNHARAANIAVSLARSDVVPESLPFPATRFDLIYAFSIFTHLSEAAARAALKAMRASVSENSLLVITVRPPEIWSQLAKSRGGNYDGYLAEHERVGFAFLPSKPGDESAHYGDTSITIDYLAKMAPGWRIVRHGATFVDPFQTFVCLRPA